MINIKCILKKGDGDGFFVGSGWDSLVCLKQKYLIKIRDALNLNFESKLNTSVNQISQRSKQ